MTQHPSSEQIIELSIEETNKLRESLGLPPLRLKDQSQITDSEDTNPARKGSAAAAAELAKQQQQQQQLNQEQEISLSVSETDALRQSLGLAPLRRHNRHVAENEKEEETLGRKSSNAIHKPAPNTHEESLIQQRLERSKLERSIQEGIQKLAKQSKGLEKDDHEPMDHLSWAERMRNKSLSDSSTKKLAGVKVRDSNIVSQSKQNSNGNTNNQNNKKGDADDDDIMQDQNLMVSHNLSDFQMGTSTILTLKDQDILEQEQDEEMGEGKNPINFLENIDMAEQRKVKQNLKQKRMVEMGMGHAGGYAGYDDDEFVELNGNVQPFGLSKRVMMGQGYDHHHHYDQDGNVGIASRDQNGDDDDDVGFRLLGKRTNSQFVTSQERRKQPSDLFAAMEGKKVTLESSSSAIRATVQEDFMTYEEEEAVMNQEEEQGPGIRSSAQEKLEKRRRKKEKKARKKLQQCQTESNGITGAKETCNNSHIAEAADTSSNLLQELEAGAKNRKRKRGRRVRRNEVDSEDSDDNHDTRGNNSNITISATHKHDSASHVVAEEAAQDKKHHEMALLDQRKQTYFSAVEKGNERTRRVFLDHGDTSKNAHIQESEEGQGQGQDGEIHDDDAHLSAAIAKARRLKRLRELQMNANASLTGSDKKTGATAVVEALQQMKAHGGKEGGGVHHQSSSNRGITFQLGTTQEFTQALRAQPTLQGGSGDYQNDTDARTMNEKQINHENVPDISDPFHDTKMTNTKESEMESNHETLEELAEQIEEDGPDSMGVLESTGTTSGVGRGMSAFLGLLKKTGEIAKKGAGAEELRGRAKDEKTYDDYAPLDLKKVVKIETSSGSKSGSVVEKDMEFANREVKLEYRDEHGRLLTRKEAFRQLCYQFHGHGSSKKKQEKRLQQVERERAEYSSQNAINSGTLGALKAAQKATGKAFVLHKT